MKLAERYTRATQSSNLKDDDRHHQTEVLAAVALSSPLGSALFRLKYANDASSYQRVLEKWQDTVAMKQWPKHMPAFKVARLSLDYWLNDVCPACSGRGYKKLPDVPVLSDDACDVCKGSGRKPLEAEPNWKAAILDLVGILDQMAAEAGARAMRKLRNDMEF